MADPETPFSLEAPAPPSDDKARKARAARAEALLADLNPPQREAVQHSAGPLLVLAGAGSGKTRALTRKIAWLVQVERVAPWQVLAVTFTNKAAAEMRERAAALLGSRADDLWLGTFHSIGVRLLRMHGHHIGLARGFVIHDDGDQEVMIKRVLAALDIDEKALPPKVARAYIDRAKQVCQGPDHPDLPAATVADERMARVYAAYQAVMKKANAVDFGDLIWLPYRLATEIPQVGEELRLRFRYILVDEFQDTNRAQYLLLRAILNAERNVCAVGDDDQSIYRWRGAEVENILRFEDDFPGARVIFFEQNYRSTRPILAVSGALIAQNVGRHGKTLFTASEGGAKVRIYAAQSDSDEAEYVARRIDSLRPRHPEIAIIYRTNAQSRSFEDRLRARGYPYKVYGGLRFYDRAEIKDVVAYLRLLVNPTDPVALERIINRPNRGIGQVTFNKIEERARREERSLWEALCELALESGGAAANKLGAFVEIISGLMALVPQSSALEMARAVLDKTDYLDWLRKEGSVEGQARIDNVESLLGAIAEFCEQKGDNSLARWLDEVALYSGTDETAAEDQGTPIVLMTAHMAKGLEFDVVFVTGIESNLMPHVNSHEDPDAIEEERRLLYVAMTRARHHLHLTHAASRRRYGRFEDAMPSEFLDDLPAEHLHEDNPRPRRPSYIERAEPWPSRAREAFDYADPAPDWENESQDREMARARQRVLGEDAVPPVAGGGWSRGMRTFHPQFGEGVVLDVVGQGSSAKVLVRFWDHRERKLVARVLSEP